MTKKDGQELKSILKKDAANTETGKKKNLTFSKKLEHVKVVESHDDLLVEGDSGLTYNQDKEMNIREINKNKPKHGLLNALDKSTNESFSTATMSHEELESATESAAQKATNAEKELSEILKSPQEERSQIVKKIIKEQKAKEFAQKGQRAQDRYQHNRLFRLTKEHMKSGVSDVATAEEMARQTALAQDMELNRNYTELVLDQRFKEEQECSCVIM